MNEPRASFGFSRPTPVVLWTLGTLVTSFVGFAIAIRVSDAARDAYELLVLQPQMVAGPPWRVWTLVTYAVLHSLTDVWHLVFNCLVLYWFGPSQERVWGAKGFIGFMLATAVAGGLFVLGAHLVGLSHAPVVGFSAVTSGLMITWGLANKEVPVYFFLFRVKGLHLVYIMIAFELLNAVSLSGTSAAGHFGGMAVGGLVAYGPLRRFWLRRRLARLEREAASLRSPRSKRAVAASGFRVIEGGGGGGRRPDPKDKRQLN